jgi:molecular chaperone GrpE
MSGKAKPDHPEHPKGKAAEPPEGSIEEQAGDKAAMETNVGVEDRLGEDLASKLEESNSRHLRLAADFENFKKRARQERAELLQYASAQLAEHLLPAVDDFDRALAHTPEGIDETWLKGVQMAVDKLHEALAGVGVETIEATGEPFDPKLHEAISSEETDQHPEDTVLGQVRRGYKMHDRVLRPALVSVARKPSQES